MNEINVDQLLQQMRGMAALAENKTSAVGETGVTGADFGEMMKHSINQVNQTQKTSAQLAGSFEKGDPSVNLSEVMVALQKASVSFQAMTQVRNNLVSAYKEVMNMQV